MATTRRTFRSGTTTVNVNVPRSRAGSTRRRPASSGRTVKQVAALSSRRSDNTPLYVGAAALAATALYLLWPGGGEGTARADDIIPGTPPRVFPQVPGASVGFAGPGVYRYMGTDGLNIRSAAQANAPLLGTAPRGSVVQVIADAGNGWFQVSPQGYMCASCTELGTDRGPGGTWLVRQS